MKKNVCLCIRVYYVLWMEVFTSVIAYESQNSHLQNDYEEQCVCVLVEDQMDRVLEKIKR